MCLLGCISASIGTIFLKIQPFHSYHIHNKRSIFLIDWSIIKGTLLGDESLLDYNSASVRGIFLEIHIWHCKHIPYKWSKFGSNQLISKGALLEERCTFSSASRFPLEGFSWKFTFGIPLTFRTSDYSLLLIGQKLIGFSWRAMYYLGFYERFSCKSVSFTQLCFTTNGHSLVAMRH
jgi:hypothetical protein